MKTTSIITAAVLFFQVSVLFAGNEGTPSIANNGSAVCPLCTLVPVTPAEANFEETTEMDALPINFIILAPVTPSEADFSDVVPENNIDLSILAPVTPSEADIEETFENQTIDLTILAPVTPSEADFE